MRISGICVTFACQSRALPIDFWPADLRVNPTAPLRNYGLETHFAEY